MVDILAILQHTPAWVFAVFALLAALGIRQWLGGSSSLRRAVLVPLAMAVWSLYSTVARPGQTPIALAAWAGAALCCAILVLQRKLPDSTRFDPATRRFHQAGSTVPLMLMMGIFLLRYTVTVLQSMHSGLAHDPAFSVTSSALYGALAGTFAARAARLALLAQESLRAAAMRADAFGTAKLGERIV